MNKKAYYFQNIKIIVCVLITMDFKCLLCKTEITDTEFEYEDYFKVIRGHGENKVLKVDEVLKGYICFDCGSEKL